MGRSKTKSAGRASYRLVLEKALVAALRIRAAEETLAAGSGCITWVDLVRRGAAAVANGTVMQKGES